LPPLPAEAKEQKRNRQPAPIRAPFVRAKFHASRFGAPLARVAATFHSILEQIGNIPTSAIRSVNIPVLIAKSRFGP
jgi:hypothetical protein